MDLEADLDLVPLESLVKGSEVTRLILGSTDTTILDGG